MILYLNVGVDIPGTFTMLIRTPLGVLTQLYVYARPTHTLDRLDSR